jgi:hypothetical protein
MKPLHYNANNVFGNLGNDQKQDRKVSPASGDERNIKISAWLVSSQTRPLEERSPCETTKESEINLERTNFQGVCR